MFPSSQSDDLPERLPLINTKVGRPKHRPKTQIYVCMSVYELYGQTAGPNRCAINSIRTNFARIFHVALPSLMAADDFWADDERTCGLEHRTCACTSTWSIIYKKLWLSLAAGSFVRSVRSETTKREANGS